MQKEVNGRWIEYNDVIHHTTDTRFSFWDRIKILLGKTVYINSEIYCKEEVSVVASEANTHVARLLPSKPKGLMYEPVQSN